MFHLIRAGVTGGKTVPESVAENPLVFATLTAPSFGQSTAGATRAAAATRTSATSRLCRARPTSGPASPRTPRTTPRWRTAVVRRLLRLRLPRGLAVVGTGPVAPVHHHPAPAPRQAPCSYPRNRLAEVATVQYAKVAEYQLRGVVHFHALVRLDGPRTPDGFAPAPTAIDADHAGRPGPGTPPPRSV